RLQNIAREAIAAAFFAFRRRGGDRVLVKLCVAIVAIFAVTWGPFLLLFRNELSALTSVYVQMVDAVAHGGPRPDPSQLPPTTRLVVLIAFVLVVIQYIALSAYEAGCLRWMLRGEVGRVWGMKIDADSWRVWTIYWIWAFFNVAVTIVIGAISYIITAASGGA